MADNMQVHRKTQDLLSRYADLKRAGRDAEGMYPDVAQHLLECESCRALLADILEPDDDFEPGHTLDDRHRSQLMDLLKQPDDEASVSVRPGSQMEAFRAHIRMPLVSPPERGMRAGDRAPQSIQHGKLLFADHVMIGDKKFGVKLDLDAPQPGEEGTYRVTGLIYPIQGELPAEIHAQLDSGRDVYYATVQADGRLCFENVVLHDDIRLNLILESE